MSGWHIYRGDGHPHDDIEERLPKPPHWRDFSGGSARRRLGSPDRPVTYRPSPEEVDLVNAALYLRRPLLITGKPGTGKSTLAYHVAHELKLGDVLYWPITGQSTLPQGLYKYDAIARLQDANLNGGGDPGHTPDISRYIRLGPLGTAFLPSPKPRVLLVDELDKSDIDLPNDLLTVFEEGEFEIPELVRVAAEQETVHVPVDGGGAAVPIVKGRVRCEEFPLILITSNEERDFPPAFLRRCLQLRMEPPKADRLEAIVRAHLGEETAERSDDLIRLFLRRRDHGELATDQLLNAIYLRLNQAWEGDLESLATAVLQHLNSRNP